MKKLLCPSLALVLLLALVVPALADTIRLKDGSVIHGQVIGFKDQTFTVLIGAGAKGRRSRTTIYVEDVESIEFDSTGIDSAGSNDNATMPAASEPRNETQPSTSKPPTFFSVKVSVRADNANNGWTNSGLVVRRGQRLRISATGRVSLGRGRFSTPSGSNVPDSDKLMRNEATGGLIAVIGDDNDDFIFIGTGRDFVAQRDGVLFLGINEGDLSDNTGTYDIVIEAEAGSGGPR